MQPFIKVNREAFPMPGRHPTLMVATLVDSARNTAGTVVGQKIGRDQYKIDSLFWPHLKADQWARILQAFSNFYVDVQFPDMVHNDWIKLRMYPGDRTAEPWLIDEQTGLPSDYINCKVNLIDVGEV